MPQFENGRSDIEKIEARLPRVVGRFMRRMRQPGARTVRIPMGILLVFGGLLGFLPVFGFWMLPLGLLLLAEDYPPAQRVIRSAMVATQRWWRRQRRRFSRTRQTSRRSQGRPPPRPRGAACGPGFSTGS